MINYYKKRINEFQSLIDFAKKNELPISLKHAQEEIDNYKALLKQKEGEK